MCGGVEGFDQPVFVEEEEGGCGHAAAKEDGDGAVLFIDAAAEGAVQVRWEAGGREGSRGLGVRL